MSEAMRAAGEVPGAIWLVAAVGSVPQFTGADFTDDDRLYAKTAEDFGSNEVLPRLEEIESKEAGVMPALLKRAGELGLLMVDIPEKYGGLGLRKATSMLVSEHGALCASFSVSWGAHTGIGTLPLVYYGTEAQKQTYLPRLATGEWLAAYALTEPGSGSDALAARTVATPEDGGYRLTGTKQFITNAGFADLFTVFAKVGGEHFTAFLVERTTPGLSTGPEEKKLGIRGSSTRQVILEDARIGADKVLGQVGQGHKIAFNILNIGRFKLGAGSVGAAKDCLAVALEYAKERQQFRRPIASFGMIPATLVKRIGQGRLSYADFFQQVDREIADRASWPPAVKGPLERELRAAEVAKRVIAYTARVLIERDLASLKDKQQHLEILANMIIDCYAMDSVVNRTRLLLGHGTPEDDELRLAMTNVFVSSANERVIDGARRLLVNELEGEELRKHLALEAIVPHMPIRTIAVKTRIAEALVARGLGPVFLR